MKELEYFIENAIIIERQDLLKKQLIENEGLFFREIKELFQFFNQSWKHIEKFSEDCFFQKVIENYITAGILIDQNGARLISIHKLLSDGVPFTDSLFIVQEKQNAFFFHKTGALSYIEVL